MVKNKIKLQNEKEYPKMYYARHMCQGVVGYEQEQGINVLVKNDTIKSMCPSFEGKPVVVKHQSIDIENLKDQMDGVVVNSFYNENDGWFWLKFMAITDECHEAIRKGWKVSNAYFVEQFGESGTFLNVTYDKEVLAGEFDHLAVVENPRYEDAIIMTPSEFGDYNKKIELENQKIKNSKENGKGKIMLKLFTKKEVEKDVDVENSFVTLENGKEISIKEMINAVEEESKKKEEEDKKKENEADEDMTIEVNGEKMKVSTLVNKYEQMCKKENEADEEDKKKEEEDKKKEESEKKEKKENEKEIFDEIKNSINKNQTSETINYETVEEKMKRGEERY